MEHQLRRIVPRQFTDWRGKYMIEGDPYERWPDCRLIDFSSAGQSWNCSTPPPTRQTVATSCSPFTCGPQ